ncbi:MAG: metalloregulator ArsR/SmtB family transcription factor [Candidatus Zixiibacteriota bacterium]
MTDQVPSEKPIPAGEGDTCDVLAFDPKRVSEAKDRLPSDRYVEDVAGLYQCLGQPTRVRILHSLFVGELCVCDLAQILGLSVSAVSHQLRILRAHRLVKYRRDGKMAYYSIDDDHVKTLFSLGLEHVQHG